MRRSTVITLGASVTFGALAVFLAKSWINDAIRSEYAKRALPIEVVEETDFQTDFRSVVVATSDLNFGDVIQADSLKVVEYPKDAIPEGNYENLNQIFVDPSRPTVVLREMARNEVILDYKISGPGARGTLSALIGEGMRAVSVRVSDVTGVSGFVMPGDFVDVIYTRDEDSRGIKNNLKSDVLLQHIKVLGIDQDLSDLTDVPSLVKTVTLEVSNIDAQKLHLAQDAGKISLTLRRAGDTTIDQARTVQQTSILANKQNLVRYVNPRQRVAKKPAFKPSSRHAEVTIFRGDEKDKVQVLKDPATDTQDSELAGG